LIGPGDSVVCIGEAGKYCLNDRPVVGEVYTVTSTYEMFYGTGCTLEGMDPFPFDGYLLNVEVPFACDMAPGWYFRRLEPVSIEKVATPETVDA